MNAIAQVLGEAVQVEPDDLGVRQQIVRVQGVLVGEEPVVHLPEPPLRAGGLGRLGARVQIDSGRWRTT